jgi:hypothetical protein
MRTIEINGTPYGVVFEQRRLRIESTTSTKSSPRSLLCSYLGARDICFTSFRGTAGVRSRRVGTCQIAGLITAQHVVKRDLLQPPFTNSANFFRA